MHFISCNFFSVFRTFLNTCVVRRHDSHTHQQWKYNLTHASRAYGADCRHDSLRTTNYNNITVNVTVTFGRRDGIQSAYVHMFRLHVAYIPRHRRHISLQFRSNTYVMNIFITKIVSTPLCAEHSTTKNGNLLKAARNVRREYMCEKIYRTNDQESL